MTEETRKKILNAYIEKGVLNITELGLTPEKEHEHQYYTGIDTVMDNPRKYIIEENLRTIEYLWSHNILTKQTNDYDNTFSFVALGKLSQENEEIYMDMSNDEEGYNNRRNNGTTNSYGKSIKVLVVPGTKDPFEDFLPIMKKFKPQDVQADGYISLDNFYANKESHCCKWIKNVYLEHEPTGHSEEELRASMAFRNKNYPNSENIIVYDETKAKMSHIEYLKKHGLDGLYDPDLGRIYYNKRLYDQHMEYKRSHPEEMKKEIEEYKKFEELKRKEPEIIYEYDDFEEEEERKNGRSK